MSKRLRMEQMNHTANNPYWDDRGQQHHGDEEEEEEEEDEEDEELAGLYGHMGGDGDEDESEEEEEYTSLEDESEAESDAVSWISYWCSVVGHEYFTEVPESFIEDQFNLTGLNGQVPFYQEAMTMILDGEYDDYKMPADIQIVENSAEMLYGLIHQRWIISKGGLQAMADKYEHASFGHCPRVFCHSAAVLPMGRSDCQAIDTVKLFCPSCLDIYNPPQTRFHNLDGAYFGTTFPHLFFQTYPELLPSTGPQPNLGMRVYTPKIYGFKVSDRAKNCQKMQWLRMIPSEEARKTHRNIRRYFQSVGESIELSETDENEEDDEDDDLDEDEDEDEDDQEEEVYEVMREGLGGDEDVVNHA